MFTIKNRNNINQRCKEIMLFWVNLCCRIFRTLIEKIYANVLFVKLQWFIAAMSQNAINIFLFEKKKSCSDEWRVTKIWGSLPRTANITCAFIFCFFINRFDKHPSNCWQQWFYIFFAKPKVYANFLYYIINFHSF